MYLCMEFRYLHSSERHLRSDAGVARVVLGIQHVPRGVLVVRRGERMRQTQDLQNPDKITDMMNIYEFILIQSIMDVV